VATLLEEVVRHAEADIRHVHVNHHLHGVAAAAYVRVHINTHVQERDIAREAAQLVIVNIQLVLVRLTIRGMVVLAYAIVVSNIPVVVLDIVLELELLAAENIRVVAVVRLINGVEALVPIVEIVISMHVVLVETLLAEVVLHAEADIRHVHVNHHLHGVAAAAYVRVHISTHVAERDIAREAAQLVIVNTQHVLVLVGMSGTVVVVWLVVLIVAVV